MKVDNIRSKILSEIMHRRDTQVAIIKTEEGKNRKQMC